MEDFVPFEIAKKLKEKGFSCELPYARYNEIGQFCLLTTSAPYRVCESGYKYREYYDYNDFEIDWRLTIKDKNYGNKNKHSRTFERLPKRH